MTTSKSSDKSQTSVCIVKPASYEMGTKILKRLKREGFTIVQSCTITLSRARAHRLYAAYIREDFFPSLIDSMICGPCGAILVSKPDAVAELRRLAGPTNPSSARQTHPDSLRALYGKDMLRNGIHASATKEQAEREADIMFAPLAIASAASQSIPALMTSQSSPHTQHASPYSSLLPPPFLRRTIILFGPPASGKGTQSALLAAAYGVIHISTGDMLRQQVTLGTPLGLEIKSYLSSGTLVPDALITQMTLQRLAQPDCRLCGWVLDGFPRTGAQAQALIDAGVEVSLFLLLNVKSDNLISRVTGRRFDPQTGNTYHIKANPPPPGPIADRCIQRDDDRQEVMETRLNVYNSTIKPVLSNFNDVYVVSTDDSDGIWDVFHLIMKGIDIHHTSRNIGRRVSSSNQRERLRSRM